MPIDNGDRPCDPIALAIWVTSGKLRHLDNKEAAAFLAEVSREMPEMVDMVLRVRGVFAGVVCAACNTPCMIPGHDELRDDVVLTLEEPGMRAYQEAHLDAAVLAGIVTRERADKALREYDEELRKSRVAECLLRGRLNAVNTATNEARRRGFGDEKSALN